MPVTSLHISDVGPFDSVTFEFDRQVNVIIGPNNSGKSTLLWVLGDLLVYPFTMPTKVIRSGRASWTLNIFTSAGAKRIEGSLPSDTEGMIPVFERVGYTCYVPAQRVSTNYRSTGPTVSRRLGSQIDEAFDQFAEERPESVMRIGLEAFRQAARQELINESHPELLRRSRLMMAGNTLVSDKAMKQRFIDLDYAASRTEKPVIKTYLRQVATLSSEITGQKITGEEITGDFPIEFLGVAEDKQGLYPEFRTPDGHLPLDVLSQGTQSIVQFVAHLLLRYAEYYDFPPDLNDKPGIAIIDEIDAHLHPTWQRRIIPALTRNFPSLQIFCSTHSPLMVAGLKEGQVQLLRRDGDGKVTVTVNESDIAGWTVDEVLRHYMDVRNPTDKGTADRASRYQELEERKNLSEAEAEELAQLRHAVRADLLSGPGSAEVLRFAEQLERARGKNNRSGLYRKGDGEESGI